MIEKCISPHGIVEREMDYKEITNIADRSLDQLVSIGDKVSNILDANGLNSSAFNVSGITIAINTLLTYARMDATDGIKMQIYKKDINGIIVTLVEKEDGKNMISLSWTEPSEGFASTDFGDMNPIGMNLLACNIYAGCEKFNFDEDVIKSSKKTIKIINDAHHSITYRRDMFEVGEPFNIISIPIDILNIRYRDNKVLKDYPVLCGVRINKSTKHMSPYVLPIKFAKPSSRSEYQFILDEGEIISLNGVEPAIVQIASNETLDNLSEMVYHIINGKLRNASEVTVDDLIKYYDTIEFCDDELRESSDEYAPKMVNYNMSPLMQNASK